MKTSKTNSRRAKTSLQDRPLSSASVTEKKNQPQCVRITLTDTEDGSVTMEMDFEPDVDPNEVPKSLSVQAAMLCMKTLSKHARSTEAVAD